MHTCIHQATYMHIQAQFKLNYRAIVATIMPQPLRLLLVIFACVYPATCAAFAPLCGTLPLRRLTSSTRSAPCLQLPAQSRSASLLTAPLCCLGQGDHSKASGSEGGDAMEVPVYEEYTGPVGARNEMEAGCVVGNLGLEITIGPRLFWARACRLHVMIYHNHAADVSSCTSSASPPSSSSKVSAGRGLFLALAADDDVERVQARASKCSYLQTCNITISYCSYSYHPHTLFSPLCACLITMCLSLSYLLLYHPYNHNRQYYHYHF